MDHQHHKANNTESQIEDDRPCPADFDVYLPFACTQLQLDALVVITKVQQQEYISLSVADKHKVKKSKIRNNSPMGSNDNDNVKDVPSSECSDENVINILAVYDTNDNLVQLKFDRNRRIPRIVLKVIGLIIQYQVNLNTIIINRGMDQYTLYEICKFLPISNITDLILDNTFLEEANYHHVLENPNNIRYLSLARCSINDKVIKAIAALLAFPLPSSKSLSILNLSTNKITDAGAKYLAECLRSNRQLSYLNLADNMLTDDGAEEILNTLKQFPMTFNEVLTSRSRNMAYLKDKNELILRIARELRVGDFDRKSIKRKSVKPGSAPAKAKGKGVEKESSLKSMPAETKSVSNMDYIFFEKAAGIAENTMGEFKDPFSKPNTIVDNGIIYSHGNNALCYLNLSFNNLSFVSLKRLTDVLLYQKKVDRVPRGLVNVSIEGNNFPVSCKELYNVDRLIDFNLSMHQRKTSHHRKKPVTKPGKSYSAI